MNMKIEAMWELITPHPYDIMSKIIIFFVSNFRTDFTPLNN